ncbi:MAG TPA: hypothetical protein VFZ78_07805 [Flavisolibacter sp.]
MKKSQSKKARTSPQADFTILPRPAGKSDAPSEKYTGNTADMRYYADRISRRYSIDDNGSGYAGL